MRLALSLMVLFVPAAALAQAPDAAQPPAAEPAQATMPARPITWELKFPAHLGFSAGFDNQAGEVQVSRVGAELEVGIPIATMSQLTLGFEYEYSRYDFDAATSFVPGTSSPFRDIHREVLRARYGQQETMQWSWAVAGYIGLSGEEGADAGDSIIGGVFGGVSYNLSESVKVGGALGVFSRLEDDPLVLPVPTLDWRIDQSWRVTNAGKPGLFVLYSPSQQWTFSAGMWYDQRNFRLDDGGPVPGGVGRDSAVPIQLGATFRPTKDIELDAAGGVRILGNYEVVNAGGSTVADVDADPAAYVSLGFTVKF